MGELVDKFFKKDVLHKLNLAGKDSKTNNKIGTEFDQSGKTFWKEFQENKKSFESKIFKNENVEDFKKYFY